MPGELVKVFTGSPTDAEMVRSVLEGSGIVAVVNRIGGGAYGLDPGPLGQTTVSVPSTELEAARELLDQEPEVAPDEEPWLTGRPGGFFTHPGVKWIARIAVMAVIATLLFEAVQR